MIPSAKNGDIKCKCCNKVTHFYTSDFACTATNSYHRGMGIEMEYTFVATKICGECKKAITVQLTIYEYPENMFNDSSIQCDDGDVL